MIVRFFISIRIVPEWNVKNALPNSFSEIMHIRIGPEWNVKVSFSVML